MTWGSEWANLHYGCHDNKVASGMGSVFDLVEPVTTGTLDLALSVEDVSSMGISREVYTGLAVEHIARTSAPPTSEAMARKTVVLDLFLGRGRAIELGRHLLLNVSTGDWRNFGAAEVYLLTGRPTSAGHVRANVTKGNFPSFARPFFLFLYI
ncbi:unnamed protein product [Prorocentrum cordatum]|uniref:Uncharacterized protein n=1 Tax=Prorocentrum cordatum TaxID=2364126 RepID=A0ABN9Q106_9DINO|nr:unnamed protein product [Polarella glacialis]